MLLGDIMRSKVYNRRAYFTVTEMTLDMMEHLGYKTSPCDLLMHKKQKQKQSISHRSNIRIQIK